jgi:purine-binding chemotaxis protein CheW
MIDGQDINNFTAVTHEMENMYLNFIVGNEIYGIEIRYVLQIVGMQKINEMPEMEYSLKGYIDLRGSIIPVYSMHIRFGKPEPDYSERTCIIIVMIDDKQIGLIVDGIEETTIIEPNIVSPTPSASETDTKPYIKGVARLAEEHNVVLLHAEYLFTDGY